MARAVGGMGPIELAARNDHMIVIGAVGANRVANARSITESRFFLITIIRMWRLYRPIASVYELVRADDSWPAQAGAANSGDSPMMSGTVAMKTWTCRGWPPGSSPRQAQDSRSPCTRRG